MASDLDVDPSVPVGDHACKPLGLWSIPRSASTAFVRMMYERRDRTVMHEPYAPAYHFGPERHSSRFACRDSTDLSAPHNSYRAIHSTVQKASLARPLFIKDIARQLGPYLQPAFFACFSNTVLVRHPVFSLTSLRKLNPDFSDAESGFPHLATAHAMALRTQASVPVIDTSDLLLKPAEMVRAWCDAVSIPFVPGALTWESGRCDAVDPIWEDYYSETLASKGFMSRDDWASVPTVDEHLAKRVDAFRPIYEALVADKLVATDSA